jgi:hypothetical protein
VVDAQGRVYVADTCANVVYRLQLSARRQAPLPFRRPSASRFFYAQVVFQLNLE